MTALPRPVVHYEMIRRDPRNPLNHLPEEVRSEILHDPFNRNGNNPLPAQMLSEYSTTYNMLRSAIAYERSGQQVVVLGPRMQEAFAHTSLKDVSSEHIRFPHPCFYLATPQSKLTIWGGSDTGWHRVEGAYVMEDPSEPDVVSVLMWGAANENSQGPMDDATFWFSLNLGNRIGSVDLDATLEKRLDEGELKNGSLRNLELESRMIRMNLDDQVESILNTKESNISDRLAGLPDTDHLVHEVKDNVKAFLRVAVNSLLYVNSASCETEKSDNEGQRRELEKSLARKKHKNGRDAKKVARDLDALPKYRVTWIGPTIETSRDSEHDLTGTRTVRGHVRRGHWHTYRVGPRKDEVGGKIDPALRKASLKWVAPVWVGGLSVDDKPRVYGVREPVTG